MDGFRRDGEFVKNFVQSGKTFGSGERSAPKDE